LDVNVPSINAPLLRVPAIAWKTFPAIYPLVKLAVPPPVGAIVVPVMVVVEYPVIITSKLPV
jgi:hypothetical protein